MNYQTLTELQARAIVHGDALKVWQRHAAEKAVTRLLQDAADTESEPATGAETIARHKSLCAPLGRSVASDEATMLRRLLTLPALPTAVANRIVTGTATLADALVALDWREDLAAERGRLRSAVERFAAKATNLLVGGPAQVSARAGAIDTLFNGLSHTDFALTQSSWSAFRSRVRRVAAIVDPDLGRTVKRSQLSGTWATLVAAIDRKAGAGKHRSRLTKQERIIANHLAKLWPLIAYCVRRGVEPEAIADQTVQDFLATPDPDRISGGFAVARNAIYAWAYLQSQVPGFPKQRLARIYSDGRSEGLHFDDLPQSLRDDWAAFVERNRAAPSTDLSAYVADDAAPLRQSIRRPAADDTDSLRQGVRRPAAKISSVRLDNLKSAVTLAANAMIAAGGSPQGLRDLVDP